MILGQIGVKENNVGVRASKCSALVLGKASVWKNNSGAWEGSFGARMNRCSGRSLWCLGERALGKATLALG